MEKTFAIDYVRQTIVQTLLQEYIKNPTKYIGNPNDLSLISFYEHLETEEEVDRFVKTVNDLANQQNRLKLIANGVILTPTNPTITNLNQCDIIPLEFTVSFRCTLEDRDKLLETLHHMVKVLKGRKQDIAELDTGKLFMVGTLGNNINGKPQVRNGDFIGTIPASPLTTVDEYISGKITALVNLKGFENRTFVVGDYLYFEDIDGKLKVAVYEYDEDSEENKWFTKNETGDYPNIIFPPAHSSFNKYSVSMSFDSERCNEPRTLNSKNYCELSFGGSATIVSASVMLGNQIAKLGIKRYKVVKSDDGTSDTTFDDAYTWLEPLEMPSGNSAETQMSQLMSNKFVNNSHTDSIAITNQYTFVIDESINLLKQFFKYSRYGIQTYITPNIIYYVVEMLTKWGDVEYNEFKAKIIESVDIEQTESDTLTITLPMQIQGDNN